MTEKEKSEKEIMERIIIGEQMEIDRLKKENKRLEQLNNKMQCCENCKHKQCGMKEIFKEVRNELSFEQFMEAMNGRHIYLSGVEFAVWFKKRGYKTFNSFCKNTVFKYPNAKKEFHPTQKNLSLFKELILDNTNENDIVFDPCAGSFTTGIACKELNRNCIGCEIYEDYFNKAKNRINTLEVEE